LRDPRGLKGRVRERVKVKVKGRERVKVFLV